MPAGKACSSGGSLYRSTNGSLLRSAEDGYSAQKVYYHIWLLHSAGLLDAIDTNTLDGPRWNARKMTMAGHEFLEMARNRSNWKKAKEFIVQKGQTLSIESLKMVLPLILKHALGLSENGPPMLPVDF